MRQPGVTRGTHRSGRRGVVCQDIWRIKKVRLHPLIVGASWFLDSVTSIVGASRDPGPGPATLGEFILPTTWYLASAGLLGGGAIACAFWAILISADQETKTPVDRPYLPTLTRQEVLREARPLASDEQAIVQRAVPDSLGAVGSLIV